MNDPVWMKFNICNIKKEEIWYIKSGIATQLDFSCEYSVSHALLENVLFLL